jgi:hypothetical protein
MTEGSGAEFLIERFRERTQTLLSRLDAEGPNWRPERSDDDAAVLVDRLPEEDRPQALEALRDYVSSFVSVASDEDLLKAFRNGRQTFAPWAFTSHEWEWNPNGERLFAPLVGDGPVLLPPPNAVSEKVEPDRPTLRAADATAARQWQTVVTRVPEAAVDAHAGLVEGKFTSKPLRFSYSVPGGHASMIMSTGSPDPPHSLQGRLRSVSVGGRTFARLGAAFYGPIMRGRNRQKNPVTGTSMTFSKKLHSWRWGQVRVLYAVDDRRHTVWVTDAYVLKAEREPPPRWSYSPPEEN